MAAGTSRIPRVLIRKRLYSPLISNPVYGYQAINVGVAKTIAACSPLLDEAHHSCAENPRVSLSRGSIEFLKPSNHRVLAYVRQLGGDEKILVVNNLSKSAQAVEVGPAAVQGKHSHRNVWREPFFPGIGDPILLADSRPLPVFFGFVLRRI